MKNSVVKISDSLYVDINDVSAVTRFKKDETIYWTSVNVKGIETFTKVPIDEVLKLIYWTD